MTGICWRLLTAFLLILAAALLRGQETADRIPILTPTLEPLRYAPPSVPISPERDPLGRYPGGNSPVGP